MCVGMLLAGGADAKAYDHKKTTVLHAAAELGYLAIASFIVHYDPLTVNIIDRCGRTPLHLAAQNGMVSED